MTTATDHAGLRPVDDRVLIEQDAPLTHHPSGLALVDPEPPNTGVVRATGPGRAEHGWAMPVAVGDRVVFDVVGGSTISDGDGNEYLLIPAVDLLAVER